MRSLFAALALLITLPGLALAQTTDRIADHYLLDITMRYQITLPRNIAAATQVGVPLAGLITITMTFPRPECLAYYDDRGATYTATQTQMNAFNAKTSSAFPGHSEMIVYNDYNGSDRVQLNIRADNWRIGGQDFAGMTLQTTNLPVQTLRSDHFIGRESQLRNILQHPGLEAYVQLGNTGSPTFFMEVTSINVDLVRVTPSRATGTPTGAFARCTRP